MKKYLRNNKGITLIALIVTIIVLIILAGVSVSLLLGENGILIRAKEAKITYEEAAIKEKVNLLLMEYITYRNETNKDLKEYLQEQQTKGKIQSLQEIDNKTYSIELDNYIVIIDKENIKIIEIKKAEPAPKVSNIKIFAIREDGTEIEAKENEIELGTKLKITFDITFNEGIVVSVTPGEIKSGKLEYTTNGTEMETTFVITGKINEKEVIKTLKVFLKNVYQKTEVEAKDIIKNPKKYYGQLVTNYECESDGVAAWRIFHADESNIYLIADNYLQVSKIPNSPNGLSITKNTDYQVSFVNIINDTTYSTGSDWIINNSKAKKWLNLYLTKYPNSNISSMKANSYMLDTNIWSEYYAGDYAEYAIGGPTIELFCESYKNTHPNQYVECAQVNSNGYKLKWSSEGSYGNVIKNLPLTGEFNNIYIKPVDAKTNGMVIASPSGQFDMFMLRVVNNSYIYTDGSYDGRVSLRPIVCLRPEVILNQTNNGYEIVEN